MLSIRFLSSRDPLPLKIVNPRKKADGYFSVPNFKYPENLEGLRQTTLFSFFLSFLGSLLRAPLSLPLNPLSTLEFSHVVVFQTCQFNLNKKRLKSREIIFLRELRLMCFSLLNGYACISHLYFVEILKFTSISRKT